jgi:hypothetical protein
MADSTTTLVPSLELVTPGPEEADLAAVAFLARYSGRTVDAYRHDLRSFFHWTANHGVALLAATRAHIELYRMSMEQRSLAASTIDRRLSTVCGYYRFAHIDGRIPANPAQYVRRPKVPETQGHGMDRAELGHLLVHRRTVRPDALRPRRAARPQRPPGVRSVRREHRDLLSSAATGRWRSWARATGRR